MDKKSDDDIIRQCIENWQNRKALNDFISHYYDFMDRIISRTLAASGLNYDKDIVLDISAAFIEKVYKGLFKTVQQLDNPKAWLVNVIKNHTIDNHIRPYRARRNDLKRISESKKSIVRLSSPIPGTENLFFENFIPDKLPDAQDKLQLKEEVQATKTDLLNLSQKVRIALKISIMFYYPPDEKTIKEIAELRNCDITTIESDLNRISAELPEKQKKRQKQIEKARTLHGQICIARKRLYAVQNDPEITREQVYEAKKNLHQKEKAKEECIEKISWKIIRPSSKQIAVVMGFPESKEKLINVLLFRGRNKLIKMMDKRAKTTYIN